MLFLLNYVSIEEPDWITSTAREPSRTVAKQMLSPLAMPEIARASLWLKITNPSQAKNFERGSCLLLFNLYLLWFSGIFILYFRNYSRISARNYAASHVQVLATVFAIKNSTYYVCNNNALKSITCDSEWSITFSYSKVLRNDNLFCKKK